MKFINVDFQASRDEVLAMLRNNERVNHKVRIDTARGKPTVTVLEKNNNKIKLSCKYVGGPTRDNGFVQGTTLRGKLSEKDGVTKLCGVITTEPVYHFFFFVMVALFIVQCIRMRGISLIPPILIVFNFFMFKNEFKKQGYIKRYVCRAQRRLAESEGKDLKHETNFN